MQIRLFLALLNAVALAGCAQVPTFRNVVYDKVSPTAQVLTPYGFPKWKTTDYRLSPGMVFNATMSDPTSALTRSAGTIGAVDGCPQTIFTLKNTPRVAPLMNPVHAPYDIKILVASPFTNKAVLNSFRNRPDLQDIPDNAFAYIRQIDYDITNIRVFEATPEQLSQAIRQVRGDAYCSLKLNPFTSQVVRRIYTGNVRIAVRWDRGYHIALGGMASRIQNSLRYDVDGNKVIFAVETDRIGF